MCTAALPACDLVVILDVLHYVDLARPGGRAARVRDALAAARRRLCCASAMRRPRASPISQWVDRTVTAPRPRCRRPGAGRSPSGSALLPARLQRREHPDERGHAVRQRAARRRWPIMAATASRRHDAPDPRPRRHRGAHSAQRHHVPARPARRWDADAIHCTPSTIAPAPPAAHRERPAGARDRIRRAGDGAARRAAGAAAATAPRPASWPARATCAWPCRRLDDVRPGATSCVVAAPRRGRRPGPLRIRVRHDGRALAEGRAVVVLNTPLVPRA